MTILCGIYLDFVLILSGILLVLSLLIGLVEAWLLLAAKLKAARKGPVVADSALESIVPAVDPVKLLDALKGLLETLKGLPIWIALFLAGVLLFWMAGEVAADRCRVVAPTGPQPTPSNAAPPAAN